MRRLLHLADDTAYAALASVAWVAVHLFATQVGRALLLTVVLVLLLDNLARLGSWWVLLPVPPAGYGLLRLVLGLVTGTHGRP